MCVDVDLAEVTLTWGLAEGGRHAQERGTQVRPQSNVRSILRGQQWRRVRHVSVHTKKSLHVVYHILYPPYILRKNVH